MMPTNDQQPLDHCRNIISAVDDLMALDTDVWIMNAHHFTQTEVEAISNLLWVCGQTSSACVLLEQWIEFEIEDGEAEPGDWEVDAEIGRLVWKGEDRDES